MKRSNSSRGRYAKRKGANEERRIAHLLTKWAGKDFGPTAQFGRTLSSGASSNYFYNPSSTLLGDIFAQSVPGWNFSIECKFYNSTTLRRYYEGTKRLSSWLEENTRDARRHQNKAVPMLVTHISRFRDMVMLPFVGKFFKRMNKHQVPCWSTYESYVVKRTKHRFRFHVILTDLQSIMKVYSCKQFIKVFQGCKWDKLNKKYLKTLTKSYMKHHSRKELNVKGIVNKALKS